MSNRTKPINSGKKRGWTDGELVIAVQESKSMASTQRKLGLKPTGGNYKGLYIHIERLGLNTNHWTGQGWNVGEDHRNFTKKQPLEEILVEDSTYTNTSSLKKRLLDSGLLEYRCYNCNLVDWLGQSISLQLEHKNGNNRDNRLINIELLCPNCHAQTDTFAGKNVKRSRNTK